MSFRKDNVHNKKRNWTKSIQYFIINLQSIKSIFFSQTLNGQSLGLPSIYFVSVASHLDTAVFLAKILQYLFVGLCSHCNVPFLVVIREVVLLELTRQVTEQIQTLSQGQLI